MSADKNPTSIHKLNESQTAKDKIQATELNASSSITIKTSIQSETEDNIKGFDYAISHLT
ncbi:CLUMA_CG005419, isoform A [Clunio marinus]|uniref:CLUMA_CG005419, isoform A n=1 Tax=Clunio marinus TaxID=568069 RepID=A0A1J1HWQ4_9DIPT|nr:CLUMA_CG005419, isoform A [Clunio marinus]